MKIKAIYFILIAALLFPCTALAGKTPVEEKVAVLITGWGLPNGFNQDYAWGAALNSIGDATLPPGHPGGVCQIGHPGSFPFSSHMGMQPHAVLHQVAGFEKYYDGFGYYKLVDGVYIGAHPSIPSVLPEDIPAEVPIVACIDLFSRGVQKFPPDPNTGADPLEGWYKIGDWTNTFPNGASDFQEEFIPVLTRNYAITGGPTEAPGNTLPPEQVQQMEHLTEEMLYDAFGNKIDVRSGFYTAVPGVTQHERDVAAEFANEGFQKMMLCRETTDNNRFANVFATGNYVKEKLCELGVLDDMEIQQTRQVGRTPEFNLMNIINLQPYIEAYPAGSTIGIVYVTRGLPWRVPNPGGPFATPHPWNKEIYHENAYLNYLSLKKALIEAYGDDYNLVFDVGSDLREDNFYTYGIDYDAPFKNIRDGIQEAKAAGLDKLIVVPGHWNYDSADTNLRMREKNGVKVNTKEELEAGIQHTVYCEDADGNIVDCANPDATTTITVAPAYTHLPEEFATSYYVALRGGLEKFGLFPKKAKIKMQVSQLVTKLDGGTVEVTDPDSKITGAKIEIPADPYPDRPEGLTDISVVINDPNDTNDCMWEDTTINIGFQKNAACIPGVKALGKAVHIGPYRAKFNRDVTIAIPYKKKIKDNEMVNVYIANDLTGGWDAIVPESINEADKLVTFKTQVLGLFQVGEEMDDDDDSSDDDCDDDDDDSSDDDSSDDD